MIDSASFNAPEDDWKSKGLEVTSWISAIVRKRYWYRIRKRRGIENPDLITHDAAVQNESLDFISWANILFGAGLVQESISVLLMDGKGTSPYY